MKFLCIYLFKTLYMNEMNREEKVFFCYLKKKVMFISHKKVYFINI